VKRTWGFRAAQSADNLLSTVDRRLSTLRLPGIRSEPEQELLRQSSPFFLWGRRTLPHTGRDTPASLSSPPDGLRTPSVGRYLLTLSEDHSIRQVSAVRAVPAVHRKPPPVAAGRLVERGDGFTLVELLVSLTASAGIVAAAYLCLQGGLESRKMIEARMDLAQKARVTLGLLRADLAQACPLYKGPLGDGSEFIGMRREIGDMEADNLDFGTRNWRPRGPGEADSCEVSWFVDRDPRTGVMGLWRRRDPTPDGEPLSGGSREEIVEGIAGLRFEYFDGLSWYESWGDDSRAAAGRASENLSAYNLGGLPDAVRITIAFPQPGGAPGTGPAPPPAIEKDVSAMAEKGVEEGFGSDRTSARSARPGLAVFGTVVRLSLAPRYRDAMTDIPAASSSPEKDSKDSGDEGGTKDGAGNPPAAKTEGDY
jgi:type II secretion system protein J